MCSWFSTLISVLPFLDLHDVEHRLWIRIYSYIDMDMLYIFLRYRTQTCDFFPSLIWHIPGSVKFYGVFFYINSLRFRDTMSIFDYVPTTLAADTIDHITTMCQINFQVYQNQSIVNEATDVLLEQIKRIVGPFYNKKKGYKMKSMSYN